MTKFKAYFYRYGKKDYETFETEKEAIDFLNSSSETGEAFGDCIVDEDGVIVRDINSSTEVIGRETPENRVGNVYKEVKKGTVENTSMEANNMFAQKLSVLNKKFNPRKEESADEFSYVYDSEEGWVQE